MTIPTILGHGVLLFGIVLAAFARPGSRGRSAARHRSSERDTALPKSCESIDPDRLPDSSSLAGVPLRILLSERSGPGPLLRDTLMIRPSTRDP